MNFDFRQPVETKNVRSVKNAVRTAVNNNRMMAVIAEIGSGKTTLFNYLSDFWSRYPNRFRVLTVKGFDMQTSRISAIMKLLIETISPDTHIPMQIERIYDTLAFELKKFTGKNQSNRVILMIDEAQDLRLQTFRDIKKLYEISGNGQDHLLSIIFFGKPHRKWDALYSSPELGFRIQDVILEALTAEELVQIAEERFKLKFENNKVKTIFVGSIAYKTPLSVEHFARSLRKELGVDDGEPALITQELVTRIPMLTYKFRFKQAGITQEVFAKYATQFLGRSVPRQRVNEFVNGNLDSESLKKELSMVADSILQDNANQRRRQVVGE